MSKNIFDEAKTILENICIDFDEHGYTPTIPSHRDIDLHFYTIYKKEIDKIEKTLELGKLYKELANLRDEMLDTCEIVDDDYYDIRKKETNLEKQIEELENE